MNLDSSLLIQIQMRISLFLMGVFRKFNTPCKIAMPGIWMDTIRTYVLFDYLSLMVKEFVKILEDKRKKIVPYY